MRAIKEFVVNNFEFAFVIVVLAGAVIINHFVVYKIAFLNIYYIPVLLAAYYLDLRKALLGALSCVLLTTIFLLRNPASFSLGHTRFGIYVSVFTWACFLFMTGIVVAKLNELLKREVSLSKGLNQDLSRSKAELETANAHLKDHADNLEKRVAERTESLAKSNQAVEELKKKVEDTLYATMDPAVVKMIIESRLRTEKRRISVLFADLRGFTHYSDELRPEMVITNLNKFLEEMEKELLGFRGHIDKYMGDGIMVEFGAPEDYEQHALMAVLAGVRMQRRLKSSDFPLMMRVGIATGEPIIGLVGKHKQTYTAIGDTVNLASRIEELCAPGAVTVDGPTHERVSRFFDSRPLAAFAGDHIMDPKLRHGIRDALAALERSPDDPESVKKAAFLFLEAQDFTNAEQHLKRAIEIDPQDQNAKVAYAEAALKLGQMQNLEIRGKKDKLRLHEITGLKDPLADRDKIPQKLHDAFRVTVDGLVGYPEDLALPVEALDGTVGHSRVVGFLSYALADSLGLPDGEKKDILLAGYLLDVGKAIIPHHLLNRSGNLSKTEFAEVVKHSRESTRVLQGLGYENKTLLSLIALHHEYPNGSGYPEGLSGDAIPMGVRILSVADEYDALTSWRPYRDRWESRAALAEIERQAGAGKFDHKVVAALAGHLGAC